VVLGATLLNGAQMRHVLLLVLLASLLLAARPCHAATPRECSDEAAAWVAKASREAHLSAVLVECAAGRQQVRLETPDAGTMSVEIREAPPPAFRETHGIGLSPLLQVDDFQHDVPAPLRTSFDGLVDWVGEHHDDVRSSLGASEALASSHYGPTEWVIVALGVVFALGAGLVRRPTRAEVVTAALLFAGAWSLRLALGSWGPLHVNGQGTLWLLAAIRSPEKLSSYGPGYPELFHPLSGLRPTSPDYAIFAANTILSALASPLLFVAGRLAGVPARAGLLAAAVAAVDGACLRMAATESYFPPLIALAIGYSLTGMLAVHLALQRRRVRAVLVHLGGALLALAAARIHPVVWPVLALSPLACVAVGAAPPLDRTLGTLVSGMLGAAAILLLYPGLWPVMHQAMSMDLVSRHSTWPGAKSLLVVGAAVALAAALARPRGLAVPAGAFLLALAANHGMYGQHPVWEAVHERLFLAFPLLAAAALLARIRLEPRWSAALSVTVTGAWLVLGLPTARSRTTEDDEFHALRPWFRALPAGCRAFYVAQAGRHVDMLPEYLAPSPEVIARFSDKDEGRIGVPVAGCVYVFHTSLCSTSGGAPLCRALEAAPMQTLWQERVAARPSMAGWSYDAAEVPISVLARCPAAHPSCGP
jgi:hypothetical protein